MRTHVPTGLEEFDATFGGLELGVLTLVVGATGLGKSVLIKQMSHAAARAELGALVYYVEDPEKRTADRYLATETGLAANDIGRLDVTVQGCADIAAAVEEATWADRIGVHFGPVTPEQILADADRVTQVGGAPVGLIAVDYAQALAHEGSMEETCASTARALNVLAGARGIATLFGSQVVSDVTRRGRHRWDRSPGDVSGFLPGLGDAMWSRRLEQYAKAVLCVHRPGYWKREMGEEARDDTLELHVPKASFGPTGWVALGWDGARSRITSKGVA